MILRLEDYDGVGIEIRNSQKEVIPAYNPKFDERIVFDLHVGHSFKYLHDETPRPIAGETIIIPRRACLRIETEELLSVPSDVFGLLSCRSSISFRGLWVPNAKVDPNFRNKLQVTVTNTTDRKVVLKKGEAFCSICCFKLTSPVPKPIRVPPEVPPIKPDLLFRIEPWVPHIITGVVSIVTSVVAILAPLYLTGKLNRPGPQNSAPNSITNVTNLPPQTR